MCLGIIIWMTSCVPCETPENNNTLVKTVETVETVEVDGANYVVTILQYEGHSYLVLNTQGGYDIAITHFAGCKHESHTHIETVGTVDYVKEVNPGY